MVNNFSKLTQLPLGKVKADGWLKEQLMRNKDGLGGHLDELEPYMIGTPYTTKAPVPNWGKAIMAGWGAEISGNYWTGLIELAFTLGDAELIAKAGKWVDEVLANRRSDGYLGTYGDGDNMFDDYNAWGTNCGMTALLDYYSATGREDVFDAVYKCMLWFCENWKGNKKSRYCGVSITECMAKCYRITGDERLLRFCEEYYDFLRENNLFDNSLEAMLSKELHYNSNHGAGYVNHIGQPAEVYACSGDKRYLDASVNAYRKVNEKAMHKTGGVTCESEYLVPVGSNVETEYCGIAMYDKSLAVLAAVTGEPGYCDDMERVMFNAAQGARKKDEKAIEYLSSPNQIFATSSSSYADGIHQVYAPTVPVACCPVMSVRMIPEFIRGIALTDSDGGLYFSLYSPCDIDASPLKIHVGTLYPFRDTVRFELSVDEPSVMKKLYFRIPEWCANASLTVNGKPSGTVCAPSSYASLEGEWKSGDVIGLKLPMKVRISSVDDSDRSTLRPLAIEYGPLLFSLPIPEKWNPYAGSPVTPLPEGWHWYDVTPDNKESGLDVYDNMGMRKHLITYNVALDETLSPDDVKAETVDGDGYVWEEPKIRLTLPAYKAPYSYPPYPNKTFEPYCEKGKAYVTDKLEIELVPYGCTALRITYFPRAALVK